MKTLSVRQPWASLIVSGLKDIENRTWAPNYLGPVLIHASSAKVPKNLADQNIFEVNNEIENEQLFGNFPEFEDLEYSAIIGYVTISGDSNDSESVWAMPLDHQWHLEDAYLFDDPIRGVKGKLNLFETVEIDIDHLPAAHKLVRRAPRLEGECLVIPVTETGLQEIREANRVELCATDEILNLVEKPIEAQKEGEYAFKPIGSIRLETLTQQVSFEVEQISYQFWDQEDGSPIKVIDWNMNEIDYFNIAILLKDVIVP